MARTARLRMAGKGWRTPLGLRGSGTLASTSSKLRGVGMTRDSCGGGDPPHLPPAPPYANIKVRTALDAGEILLSLGILLAGDVWRGHCCLQSSGLLSREKLVC